MNIFLTGGNGFIGRNIVEQLGQKHTIFAPGHKDLDLLDAEAVKTFMSLLHIDAVVHAANVGGNKRDSHIQNTAEKNIRMFFNIARCLKPEQKMIFLGSGAEYGKQEDVVSVEESDFDKRVPTDEYGFSKYVCSKYIEGASNIVNLRCYAVFGKYEDETQRFISHVILSALSGKGITIRQNALFDFVYVDDVIRIIDYFLDNTAKEKFYNVASSGGRSLLDIAEIVKKVVGSTDTVAVEQEGMSKQYTANNIRLLEEIPNFKYTDLETSIQKFYEYYKNISK